MLVVEGEPLELHLHLRRLAASLRDLYGASLPENVHALVIDGARGHELARIRVTVRPVDGEELESEVKAAAIDPAIVLPTWERSATLRPYAVEAIGPHKWADRSLLERLEEEARSSVPLLVDLDGAILEASRANVFVVRDGTVSTPPCDGRILPGVTRTLVLELADEVGLDAGEAVLSLDDLRGADEVFLTGAIRGVEPVKACGDATWQPGAVTGRLAEALRRRWMLVAERPSDPAEPGPRRGAGSLSRRP